jgi:uncharacterized membrane protein YfcA
VGGIALSGGLQAAWQRRVDWRNVAWFGIPGIAATYAGAWLSRDVPGAVQLVIFAAVMLVAAMFMARSGSTPTRDTPDSPAAERHPFRIVADGLLVGLMTGFVGIGGGFLIVPALVLLGGVPIHLATGTSLWIIAANAFTGFLKHRGVIDRLGLELDVPVILSFVAVGAAGSFAGRALAGRLPQQLLRRVFAVFLVLIALLILWREVPRVGS